VVLDSSILTCELGIDDKIILISILKKWDGEVWTGLIWLRIGKGDGLF
jgi:hypothetical protein